ncbi:hypothetical protein NBRC116589_44720 [Ruegeria sp. HU-ET01832]|uniref:primase-helicase family protein n=1 Tax=Ruegeria sp. HU-ET01832 TaxID=3135906 RepID=UPI0031072A1F
METNNNPVSGAEVTEQVQRLAKAYGDQIVRRDNKFFDVENLSVPLSRNDVERMILNRVRDEYPEVPLSKDLVKGLFKLLIEAQHTDADRSFQVWNGTAICEAGNSNRLIRSRGAVAANTWVEPEYRQLRVNFAELGIIGQFFDEFFQLEHDREQFLNWLAWSLQNEGEKPSWAPFLYSRGRGTGKSTTARILTELFGTQNTVVPNNVSKLTQQFNATVLTSKLVVCEETQIKPGSPQENAIKTFITDPYVLIERKGIEAERAKQSCCFLFTSNIWPSWIGEGERRYLVMDVNHDGRSGGSRANEFSNLVGQVHQFLDDPANVSRVYNALMQRQLPEGFSAKSLNIADHQTPTMERLHQTSRDTIVDRLEEELNASGLVALPEAGVVEFVQTNLKGNINQTKHLMDELDWRKTKAKWGGKDYQRAIWVKSGYWIDRGKIHGPDFEPVSINDHIAGDTRFAEVEII